MSNILSERIQLPGGGSRTTETRIVEVVLLPFMRSRKVYFKAEGLIPNMRHRPFFDGIDVSSWCKAESFVNISSQAQVDTDGSADFTEHPDGPSNLVSNQFGEIEGSFYVPNTPTLRFRAGTREFKLLDFQAPDDAQSISRAFASYTAQGTLERRETTVTTIRPLPVPPPITIRWQDPVAQSFVIDKEEGCFITSVDVFMSTKSATVPLRVEIRPVELGLPTGRHVPGAQKIVRAANVNVSANPNINDSNTYTRVVFDTPVYLEGFREYAVVLIAETDDYNTWTAVMTEFTVGSNSRRITQQPSMGSFFKSQNGTTWTPDQSRNLMFRLNRAVFTTNTGTAYFENIDNLPIRLGADPLEVLEVASNARVRVNHPNHGLYPNSRVVISGADATRGFTAGQLNTTHIVTEVGDNDTYIIEPVGTSTSVGRGGGSAVRSTPNYTYSTLFVNANQMVLPRTRTAWAAAITSGKSVAGVEQPYVKTGYAPIAINDNIDLRAPGVVASKTNEDNTMSGARSFSLRATLTTDSNYISPVIDLSRISATLVGNRVDRQSDTPLDGFNVPSTFVAETHPSDGTSAAKHVFRPITLSEPAVGLKVLFAANRPPASEIELYYRVKETGSDTQINTLDWVRVDPDEVVSPDDEPSLFREYEYTVNGLADFDRFQFKLVFKSTNIAAVPRVKDFRAIALGT
jgi:hypothetical protein